MRSTLLFALAAVLLSAAAVVSSAAEKFGLKTGTPVLKSATRLAFGPEGILFIGDAKAAAIVAVDTGDTTAAEVKAPRNIDDLKAALAKALGGSDVELNDLAVNPASGNIYLAVTVNGQPALARIGAEGKVEPVPLKDVPTARVDLPNAPEDKVAGEGPRARNRRLESVTDMAYVDGRVLVAGSTAGENSSNVREVKFPFAEADTGANVEIFHAAHGRNETYATVRTFVPMNIDGKPALLAGFTCTPLVRLDVAAINAGGKVRGTTIAELGNRNTPIDMISYEKGGQTYLLMANTARGVMKISTEDVGRANGLTEPVKGGGTAGQKFETIASLEGTVQLDKYGDSAIVVVQSGSGLALKTVPLP